MPQTYNHYMHKKPEYTPEHTFIVCKAFWYLNANLYSLSH